MTIERAEVLRVLDSMRTCVEARESRRVVGLSKVNGHVVAKARDPGWITLIWQWFFLRRQSQLKDELGKEVVKILGDTDVDFDLQYRVVTLANRFWSSNPAFGKRVTEGLPVADPRTREPVRDRIREAEGRAALKGASTERRFFDIPTDSQGRIERINKLLDAFYEIRAKPDLLSIAENQKLLCELHGYLTFFPNSVPADKFRYDDFQRFYQPIDDTFFDAKAKREFIFALRDKQLLAEVLDGSVAKSDYINRYLDHLELHLGASHGTSPDWRITLDDIRVLTYLRASSVGPQRLRKVKGLLHQIEGDNVTRAIDRIKIRSQHAFRGVDIEALAKKATASLTSEEQRIVARARKLVSETEEYGPVSLDLLLSAEVDNGYHAIDELNKAFKLVQAHPKSAQLDALVKGVEHPDPPLTDESIQDRLDWATSVLPTRNISGWNRDFAKLMVQVFSPDKEERARAAIIPSFEGREIGEIAGLPFFFGLFGDPNRFALVREQEVFQTMCSRIIPHLTKEILKGGFDLLRHLKTLEHHFPSPHPIGQQVVEALRAIDVEISDPHSPLKQRLKIMQNANQYRTIAGQLVENAQRPPEEQARIKIITAAKIYNALGEDHQALTLLDKEMERRVQSGRVEDALGFYKAMPKNMREKYHPMPSFGKALQGKYSSVLKEEGLVAALRYSASIPSSLHQHFSEMDIPIGNMKEAAAICLSLSSELLRNGRFQELDELFLNIPGSIKEKWLDARLVYFDVAPLQERLLAAMHNGTPEERIKRLNEVFNSFPKSSYMTAIFEQGDRTFVPKCATALNTIFKELCAADKVSEALDYYRQLPLHLKKEFAKQAISVFPLLSRQVATELPPDKKRIYYVDVLKEQGRISVNPKHIQVTLQELPGLPKNVQARNLDDLPKAIARFSNDDEFQNALMEYIRGSPDFSASSADELPKWLGKLVAFARGAPDTPYSADLVLMTDETFLENMRTMLYCVLQGLDDPNIPMAKKAQALVMLAEGGAHCSGGNVNSAFNAYDLLYEPEQQGLDPLQQAQKSNRRQLLRMMERNRLAAVDAISGIAAAEAQRDPIHTKFNIMKGLGKDFLGLRLADVLPEYDPYAGSGLQVANWRGGEEGLMADFYRQYDSNLIIGEAVARSGDYDAPGMIAETLPERVKAGLPVEATAEFLPEKVIDAYLKKKLGEEAFKALGPKLEDERNKLRGQVAEKNIDAHLKKKLGEEAFKALGPKVEDERNKVRRQVETEVTKLIDPSDRESYYLYFETQQVVGLKSVGDQLIPLFKPRIECIIELLQREDYVSFS